MIIEMREMHRDFPTGKASRYAAQEGPFGPFCSPTTSTLEHPPYVLRKNSACRSAVDLKVKDPHSSSYKIVRDGDGETWAFRYIPDFEVAPKDNVALNAIGANLKEEEAQRKAGKANADEEVEKAPKVRKLGRAQERVADVRNLLRAADGALDLQLQANAAPLDFLGIQRFTGEVRGLSPYTVLRNT